MDIIKKIEQLARHAIRENVPVLHVADRVMAEIQSFPPEDNAVLGWFGGLSVLAASIVFVMSLQAWQTLCHPLFQMMVPLQDIHLW